ncbi:hypothetical protein WICPIJ_000417 [Wickerhamomyces pijperi]|uniref:Uncharacterized protein n=1 Tax=Wickerhamomyces pijperi TaxID=599730 RepID=A0A9P8QCN8_WICPI|nr:hypothetical protein WICPIJ_000417 [Wickerhamomyces pijperi]
MRVTSSALNALKPAPKNHTLKALQQAFPSSNFPTYQEIYPLAAQLRRTTIDASGEDRSKKIKPLFVNKDMKSLNLEDILRLIEIDSKYKDVKFTLLTNEKSISRSKINPLIRMLLNNGMSYTVNYNEGHRVMDTLNTMVGADDPQKNPVRNNSIMEVREQVYLEVLRKKALDPLQEDTLLFKQVDINPAMAYKTEIPFQLEGEELKLIVPSLAILPRLFGLGVHRNHPNFENMIKKRASLPEIKSNPLAFYEIKDEHLIDTNDPTQIIGLFPHHIKSHRELFPNLSFTYVKPGKKIKYEENFYNYISMNEYFQAKFPTAKHKVIEIIPFVAQNYYESVDPADPNDRRIKGKRLTKVINSHVVFDDATNDCLYSINQSKEIVGNFQHYHQFLRPFEYSKPFHRVSFYEILEFINFKQGYKYKEQLGFKLDSDLLRGYLLSQDTKQGRVPSLAYDRLIHNHQNMENLTFVLEQWLTTEDMSSDFDRDSLTPMDLFLLNGYIQLMKSQINIIHYTRHFLVPSLMYVDILTVKSDPTRFENAHKFFNFILLKFLNEQVQKHYPVLYNYYRVKVDAFLPSHSKVKYTIPQSLTSKNAESTLFEFIYALQSTPQHYPELYVFKLCVKKGRNSFRNDKYIGARYIRRLIERFNGEDYKLPQLIHTNTAFFRSSVPNEAVVYKFIPLSRDLLMKRLKELDFKVVKDETLEELCLRIRLILIADLNRFRIRDRFTLDFVEDLLESLDTHFPEQYESYLNSGASETSPLNVNVIEDYEARINPFVKKPSSAENIVDAETTRTN